MQWPALSAVAGSVATSIALLSLLRATGLERERVRDRAAETRAGYFKALLTKPLSREADRLARLIQARAKQLIEELANVSAQNEREALVAAAIEEIHEGFLAFHHELRVATGAWDDAEMTARLYRATEDWEDQTQPAMAALLAPGRSVENLRKGCTAYRTSLRRLLYDSDPLLKRENERSEPGNAVVRFFRGV